MIMPTSMLDALAQEQDEILQMGIEATKLGIEVVRRSNLLRQQIRALAVEARRAPPTIAADASEAEVLQFLAEHFPNLLLGTQDEIRDPPDHGPAAQEDGAEKQGSAASVSGGAEACVNAEAEQVVADVASGEQEEIAPLRDDPGAAPDDPKSVRDQALDLFAGTDARPGDIARQIGSTAQAVGQFIRSARAAGDHRAAEGDLRRQPPEHEEQPGLAIVTETVPPGLPTIEPTMPGDLAEIDLDQRRITFEGVTIEVARHELRLVHFLNDQKEKAATAVMAHVSAVSENRLRQFVEQLNGRLAQIHLTVHRVRSGRLQLRRLQVA